MTHTWTHGMCSGIYTAPRALVTKVRVSIPKVICHRSARALPPHHGTEAVHGFVTTHARAKGGREPFSSAHGKNTAGLRG